MNKIDLDDPNNAIEREKLFLKAASRYIENLEFERIPEDFSGKLVKSEKEMLNADKNQQAKIDAKSKEQLERKLNDEADQISGSNELTDLEEFEEKVELSRREKKLKRKKRFSPKITRSARRNKVKAKRYRHRN